MAETPEFREWVNREFPQAQVNGHPVSRRTLSKSCRVFLLAGFGSGCRRPEQRFCLQQDAGELRSWRAAVLRDRDADAGQRDCSRGEVQ